MQRSKLIFSNILELLKITWQEDKVLLFGYFLSTFLGVIVLFVVYYVYKIMIDQVSSITHVDPSTGIFLIITTYLIFEYLSRFVNYTFSGYYFEFLVRAKLQQISTRKFMEKLGSLDFVHLEDGDMRNLIAKLEDSYAYRLPEMLRTINAVFYNILSLLFSMIIALKFNFLYFLLLGLVSMPIYYFRAKYGNVSWSLYTSNAPKTNYLSYLRNLFTNFQTLAEMKIYSLRDYFLDKTKKLQDEVYNDYKKPITQYSMISTISFIFIPIAIYFALTNFILGIEHHQYTIGDFTFFLNTLFTFSGQISSILVNVGTLYESSLFLNDFFSFLHVKNTVVSPPDAYRFEVVEPREIKFVNVSFMYPNQTTPALNNISFTIHKGEDIALVGHNGAGKTTLIKLLLRFYDPTEGAILVDGIDLRQIAIDSWYDQLGILFQDFARYNLSLTENIEAGNIKQKTNKELLKQSIVKAQGEDVLNALPKGFDQILGKWFAEGRDLSTGQWQKVAIARALYRQAPILILDEPTANIDVEAEFEIFKNLTDIYKDKSLIFISHRFSTVRMADRIFVLQKGQIIEEGTHQELMEQNGVYEEYFKIQKKGYE